MKYLREQGKGTKHVTFDPNARYVTVSGTDGILYVYSLTNDEPEVVRKLDGVIRKLEPDAEATAKAVWHPDGTAFAVAEATRDISIYSISNWKKEKTFAGGHSGDITSLSWAPNGTLLASAGADGRIVLWKRKRRKLSSAMTLEMCLISPGTRPKTLFRLLPRMVNCSSTTTLFPRTTSPNCRSPCRLLRYSQAL